MPNNCEIRYSFSATSWIGHRADPLDQADRFQTVARPDLVSRPAEEQDREGQVQHDEDPSDGAHVNSGGDGVAGGADAFYTMDYAPAEFYATADFGSRLPWGVYVDYAVNVDAETIPTGPSQGKKLDTAYALGASLGAAKNARRP